MKIVLLTGNKHKAAEWLHVFPDLTVIPVPSVDEIQSDDPCKILYRKFKDSVQVCDIDLTNTFVIVEDVSLDILNGLPGAFVKYFDNKTLVHMSNVNIVSKAICRVAVKYIGMVDYFPMKTFTGTVEGIVTDGPSGPGGDHGFDPIFYHQGSDKFLSELSLDELYNLPSHRYDAARQVETYIKSLKI